MHDGIGLAKSRTGIKLREDYECLALFVPFQFLVPKDD